MKLAWICQKYDGDLDDVRIAFTEPESWMYFKVTPIVFAEIQQ